MKKRELLLVNIAGFASSGNNKTKQLEKMFPNVQVKNVTTSGKTPTAVIDELLEICNNKRDAQMVVFIGSLLGGFYAYIMADLVDTYSILINPSLRPWITLTGKIGTNKIYETAKEFELTSNDISDLKNMADKYGRNRNHQLMLFVGLDDNRINFDDIDELVNKPMVDCRVANADHQFSNISIIKPFIEQIQLRGTYNETDEPLEFIWDDMD